MPIPPRIKWFLDVNRVDYEVIAPRIDPGPPDSGPPGDVPDEKLARGVLLQDEEGYLLPVLAANRELDLNQLRARLDRNLKPAREEETASLFFDCQAGMVPVVGSAYGIQTIIDDELLDRGDFFFDAGDLNELIHIEGKDFLTLLPDAPHAPFSVAP